MKNDYEIRGNDVVIFINGYEKIWECFIDLKDLEKVSSIKNRWYVGNKGGIYYPYYQPYIDGKRTSINIHQFLLDRFGKNYDMVIDHIDSNPMNNRRSNLQLISQGDNVRKASLRSDNKTGYKHINWQESRKRYKVEINKHGIYKFVGRFKKLEDAVKARDIYLEEIKNKQTKGG